MLKFNLVIPNKMKEAHKCVLFVNRSIYGYNSTGNSNISFWHCTISCICKRNCVDSMWNILNHHIYQNKMSYIML